MKTLLIFLMLIFFGNLSQAQDKVQFYAGTSVAFPIASKKFLATPDDSIKFERDYAVFPPQVELGLQFGLGEKWTAGFNARLRGLQNTRFVFNEERFLQDIGTFTYEDTFKVRTNVVGLGVHFRYHFNGAPRGNYLELGTGIAASFCKMYPTMVETFDPTGSDPGGYSDTLKLTPWKQMVNLPFFTVGLGKTTYFSGGTALDFGVKSTYHFGPRKFEYTYSPALSNEQRDFKTTFESTVKSLVTRNLNSSYLLEFFVRINLPF